MAIRLGRDQQLCNRAGPCVVWCATHCQAPEAPEWGHGWLGVPSLSSVPFTRASHPRRRGLWAGAGLQLGHETNVAAGVGTEWGTTLQASCLRKNIHLGSFLWRGEVPSSVPVDPRTRGGLASGLEWRYRWSELRGPSASPDPWLIHTCTSASCQQVPG